MLLGSRSGCVGKPACAAANLNSRCIKLVGPGWRLNIFEFYGSGKDISPDYFLYIYVRFRGVYCILLLYLYQLLRIFVIHSYYHAIHIISYNHKYIQWSYSVLCTDFYILFKKNCDCFFFFKGCLCTCTKAGLSFMAYETLKAQIADLNGDLGVHQRLLPGAFWKKTRGGLGVFPFFFLRTCTKKKQTRKKTGFVFFSLQSLSTLI